MRPKGNTHVIQDSLANESLTPLPSRKRLGAEYSNFLLVPAREERLARSAWVRGPKPRYEVILWKEDTRKKDTKVSWLHRPGLSQAPT
jgi:hypothetical protein